MLLLLVLSRGIGADTAALELTGAAPDVAVAPPELVGVPAGLLMG